MLALAGAGQLRAAPITFGGFVSARAGYGDNPRLRLGSGRSSAIVGVNISPTLTKRASTSTTTLSGNYDREKYFRRTGDAETAGVALSHQQQFNERLSGQARVGYSRSNNPYIGGVTDDDLIDPLAIGTRSSSLAGSASLSWQPTASDGFVGGASARRARFRRSSGLSNYSFYSGNFGYSRRVSARTQLGAAVTYSRTSSARFRNLEAIQPSITLGQQLTPNWRFDGGLGVILQRSEGSNLGLNVGNVNNTSLGFNASLCGTYPRTSLCVRAARANSASGFGGGRTTLSGGISLSQTLSERETLSGGLNYSDSESALNVSPALNIFAVSQRVGTANLNYQRTLTPRLSAGVTGRYQFRTINGFGTARSAAVTANLRLRIGRIG